jgi:hypothetical protein
MPNLTIGNQFEGQATPGPTKPMTILANPGVPGEFIQPFIQVDASGTAITSALTPNAPTSVSVTTSSTTIIAANTARKRLEIKNTGSARISFGLGVAAVNGSGIVLDPGQSYCFETSNLYTGGIRGIATATSTLAVQEWQ